jgi:hypothetical protein
MRLFEYSIATGRVSSVHERSDGSLPDVGDGNALIEAEGSEPQMFFVVDGEVHERAQISASWSKTEIAADGVDTAVLSALPNPCTVNIDGETHVILGGALEFTALAPGVYRIFIDEVAYRPRFWEITAV